MSAEIESRIKYLKTKNKIDYNRSLYDKRIRTYLLDNLKVLSVAAEYLSEDQQKLIFNSETILSFLNNLLKLRIDLTEEKVKDGWEPMLDEEISERRKRILKLVYSILTNLAIEADDLAPEQMGVLRDVGYQEDQIMLGIKAIFSKSKRQYT